MTGTRREKARSPAGIPSEVQSLTENCSAKSHVVWDTRQNLQLHQGSAESQIRHICRGQQTTGCKSGETNLW